MGILDKRKVKANKMKISTFLVPIAAARRPAKRQPEESRVGGDTEFNCGEILTGVETDVLIQSPGWPGMYPNDQNCLWIVENECAASFTISPRSFALEQQPVCGFDRLTFSVLGVEEKQPFCGGGNGEDDYSTADYSSYSSYDDGETIFNIHGMTEEFTIDGSELHIQFKSDAV